ncbi:MAG TPA: hypothetical protein VMB80_07040 [Candidatus Acidoferrum sp.]|nr:hypothetical protein [Candidatus Acidoferrum sp.]
MKDRFVLFLAGLAIIAATAHASPIPAKTSSPPPPNDSVNNAQVETGYHWYAYGVTRGATHENREDGKAIWYSWTAPASGVAVVNNWNEHRPFGSFSVFTGTIPAALKPVRPLMRDRMSAAFITTLGTTYLVSAERQSPPNDGAADFTLELVLKTLALTQPKGDYNTAHPIPLSIATTELPSMVESVKYYVLPFPLGEGSPILVAESDSPPYSALWTNAPPGDWFVYAELKRTDDYVLDTELSEIHLRFSNDNFADRTVLTGANTNVNYSVADATIEAGEPAANSNMLTGDIWFSWTAPAAGNVFIPHIYGNMAEAIHVFTGDTLATLSGPIATMDNAGNDVPVHVAAGETLQIAVFDLGSLSLTFYGSPTNDSFASATLLSGTNVSLTGNILAATREPGESVPSGAGGHTTWYAWTAPTNGMLVLQGGFTDGGSSGPLVVTMYTGNSLASLTGVATNDLGIIVFSDTACVPVRGGTTYKISLDNSSAVWEVGNLGDFSLQLSFAPAPTNDDFVNRFELIGDDTYFDYTSLGASTELGEPGDGACSLWWTWTAPHSGTAMVSGILYTPLWGNAYTGTTLAGLSLVGSRNGYFYWDVQGGQTYQIQILTPGPELITARLHLHYYTYGTPIEP